MPLIKKPKQTQVKNYRIPPPIKLESDLWGRPEYEAYDYADMIMSILEENGATHYSQIRQILIEHNIPADTGQIWYGLNLIKDKIHISKTFLIKLDK